MSRGHPNSREFWGWGAGGLEAKKSFHTSNRPQISGLFHNFPPKGFFLMWLVG